MSTTFIVSQFFVACVAVSRGNGFVGSSNRISLASSSSDGNASALLYSINASNTSLPGLTFVGTPKSNVNIKSSFDTRANPFTKCCIDLEKRFDTQLFGGAGGGGMGFAGGGGRSLLAETLFSDWQVLPLFV